MANDTVSMSVIFPVCRDVLQKLLLPIHYAKLTKLALQEIGVDANSVNMKRQIEDVREKLEKKVTLGVFYTGRPLCVAGLKSWFEDRQMHLFNLDVVNPVVIPGCATSGTEGAFEALMRFPHMMQKSKSASPEARAMGCARGMIIEKHVFNWFSANWNGFIFPPDNDGKYTAHCDHDFKISAPPRGDILIDVWGPDYRGVYVKPKRKKHTHLHLQCRISDDKKNVIWDSVVSGSLYKSDKTVFPEAGMSPRRMVVWLNCMRDNLAYGEIKRLATV